MGLQPVIKTGRHKAVAVEYLVPMRTTGVQL